MNKQSIIYELIIKDLPLNNLTLKEAEITEIDIQNMIDDNFLKLNFNNEYELSTIDSLYQYGLKMEMLRFANKADICFEKCYKEDPNNELYFQKLILYSLKTCNYKRFFKLFPLLTKEYNEENVKDRNMLIHLLSQVTKIPHEYYGELKTFDYDDYVLSYKCQTEDKEIKNEIKMLIIKSKYKYALKLTNNFIANKETTKLLVLKELLGQVLSVENNFKYDLLLFTQRKEYANIVSYLDTKSRKRYLKNNETYILLVAKAICDLLETRKIKPVIITKTGYMYDALKGNNFELAKRLNYRFKKNNSETIEDNILDVLLTEIVDLIEEIKYEESISEEKGPSLIKQL